MPKLHKTNTNTRKMNIEILKRVMSEKKITLPLLNKQDWKIVKTKYSNRKINKLLTHMSTNKITELNKLIYTGAKFVCDKITVSVKNTKRNSKPRWKLRLEMRIRNLR